MDSYELRSEIEASGVRYFIQSNLVPSQRVIVTSLFHEGNLLSKQSERFDSSLGKDDQRSLVRRLHEERKTRITSLLEIREALKKKSDSRAHLRLGEAFFTQKLFNEAMAEVIRSIKLGMETSQAYSILGNCLIAIGDFDKALKSFHKGLEISPKYPDLHNDLGEAFLKVERCRDAATSFEKALELNKYYQKALLNLAITLALNVVLKQDYELSRDLKPRLKKTMEMNLQLKPSLDTEEFRAALAAVETEHYDVAYEKLAAIKQELAKVAESDLSLELYLILKFRSHELTEEEIDRSVERLMLELDANPGYADLQNDLGILYTAKCKLFIDKAHTAFQEALSINRNFRRAEKNVKLAANDKQGIHFLLKALLD
ncbi:MAG: tetratricopeptide repeat protein [Candidatus Krumholzibacteria bacterium]|nr:tetratricopeptide repeat protein [Candidatus Krumholzibacteria bacterium]